MSAPTLQDLLDRIERLECYARQLGQNMVWARDAIVGLCRKPAKRIQGGWPRTVPAGGVVIESGSMVRRRLLTSSVVYVQPVTVAGSLARHRRLTSSVVYVQPVPVAGSMLRRRLLSSVVTAYSGHVQALAGSLARHRKLSSTVTAYGGNVHNVSGSMVRRRLLTSSVVRAASVGLVVPFAGSVAPLGYLLCDGTSYLRATYPDLFSVIGTTFGSADGTHFNVPDMRRQVPMGAGGTAVSGPANTVGSQGGEETHVLSIGELALHTHLAQSGYSFATLKGTGGGSSLAVGTQDWQAQNATASTGSNTAHNNVQPSLVLNYVIQY